MSRNHSTPPARRRSRSDAGTAGEAGGRGLLARVVARAAAGAARRPKTVIALWLVMVVGLAFAGATSGIESLSDTDVGTGESRRAERAIDRSGLADPAVESVLIRSASSDRSAAAARSLMARARALPEVSKVAGPSDSPDLSKAGGRTVLVQVTLRGPPDDAPDHVAPLERAVDDVRDAQPGVTLQQAGPGSFDKAIDDTIAEDLEKSELFSVPVTLIILVLAFGAVVAASVPLLLGLTSVAAAMGALGLISQVVPDGGSSGPMVVLIGLAVGVDYSLFYIRREREEKRAGRGDRAALEAAAATVGRAILVSGLTVIVALAGLLVTGLSVFLSMTLATMAVVAIAVVGSLTVLPAALALLRHRIDRGRIPLLGRRRARGGDGRVWGTLAGVVTRRPLASLVVAVCLLGALAMPAVELRTADPGPSILPKDVPAVAAYRAVERAFPGTPSTSTLVVRGERLDSARARAGLEALGERAREAVGGSGAITVRVADDGRTAVVDAPMPDRGAERAEDAVRTLRDEVAPTATRVSPGAREALVSGQAASSVDFNDRLSERTPLVIGFVLALAFALLVGAFRSPRLAAAVIGLNLLSVGAAYGVLVGVFQHDWAESLLNFDSDGTLVSWVPLFCFVILFGLSMDYTVLVLERVREARRNGRSARAAAAEGVAATAGTVTSAAIVMVAVFAIFAMLRMAMFKQLGVGLGAAILIDATIVRGIALPAAIALLGERGWRVEPTGGVAVRWDDEHRAPVPALGASDVR